MEMQTKWNIYNNSENDNKVDKNQFSQLEDYYVATVNKIVCCL